MLPAMNDRINEILGQMAALEAELRTAVHEQESRMFFQIKGKRVEFERSVQAGAPQAQDRASSAGWSPTGRRT